MAAKKTTGAQTAAENATVAENGVKNEQVANSTNKEEKGQETANKETTEGGREHRRGNIYLYRTDNPDRTD